MTSVRDCCYCDANNSKAFRVSNSISDSCRQSLTIFALWLLSSAFVFSGCKAQDIPKSETNPNSAEENNSGTALQEPEKTKGLQTEPLVVKPNAETGNAEGPSGQQSQQDLKIKQDSDGTPGNKPSINRRPTKPTDAASLADRPEKPKFLPSDKPAVAGEALDLTFDDLAFEMKENENFAWSMITPEIHQLDGAKVRLRGFIKPSFQKDNIKQFVFVRDNQECCFGPGAALYDCVLVKMATGAETDYTVRPITLEGTLYLRKYAGPDGNVWAIYRMKEGKVR